MSDYFVSNDKLSYAEAEEECKRKNAVLATVKDARHGAELKLSLSLK